MRIYEINFGSHRFWGNKNTTHLSIVSPTSSLIFPFCHLDIPSLFMVFIFYHDTLNLYNIHASSFSAIAFHSSQIYSWTVAALWKTLDKLFKLNVCLTSLRSFIHSFIYSFIHPTVHPSIHNIFIESGKLVRDKGCTIIVTACWCGSELVWVSLGVAYLYPRNDHFVSVLLPLSSRFHTLVRRPHKMWFRWIEWKILQNIYRHSFL